MGRDGIQPTLTRLDRLDDVEAFEFGVAEIKPSVLSGVAMGTAERFGPRPGIEIAFAAPDCVRRVQYVVVVFWASQQVKSGEARNTCEMAITRRPDLLEVGF